MKVFLLKTLKLEISENSPLLNFDIRMVAGQYANNQRISGDASDSESGDV